MKPTPEQASGENLHRADRGGARPRVGISACLLGKPVRHDGGHKRDGFLLESLGRKVDWVSVCPEVECGLTVPRASMDLTGDPESPHLVSGTGEDHTERMMTWTRQRLRGLEQENLCGFVFKCRSPSCGIEGVPVYEESGVERQVGVGIFARAFIARFPSLPVADEESLHKAWALKNFVESVSRFHTQNDGFHSSGSTVGETEKA